jgi:multidrug resistance efflux pump
MSDRSSVPVPWKLALRRARYQIVPVSTMLISALLAGWLWVRHSRSATATGEVSAVRVAVESRVEGLLEELPQPVHLFDTVRNGQLVARVDLSLVERQIQRLRAEVDRMRAATAAATTQLADPLIAEREAQIADLQARLDAREVKSPIDGTVMEIRERPGQSARLTKPIMIIEASEAPFIIGYLREDQPLRPAPGMNVTVRTRGGVTPRRTFETYVAGVGPQIAPMPARHLRNPAVAEWGLPVQVAMPAGADLKPSELVDLVFHPKEE